MGRPLLAPRELVGQTFGGWLVVGPPETPDPCYPSRIAYLCRCLGCTLEERVWRHNVLARQGGCRSCAMRAGWSRVPSATRTAHMVRANARTREQRSEAARKGWATWRAKRLG